MTKDHKKIAIQLFQWFERTFRDMDEKINFLWNRIPSTSIFRLPGNKGDGTSSEYLKLKSWRSSALYKIKKLKIAIDQDSIFGTFTIHVLFIEEFVKLILNQAQFLDHLIKSKHY